MSACSTTPGTYYKPALVFPERLGNSDRYIAEAAAHECGHTLGLLHDGTTTGTEYYAGHGTGATGWAPIMGNGYYKSLTQWSKGEYASQTTPRTTSPSSAPAALPTELMTTPEARRSLHALASGTRLAPRASSVDR